MKKTCHITIKVASYNTTELKDEIDKFIELFILNYMI